MSRTAGAHLAALKVQHPAWRFERIDETVPPTPGGFPATRRDDPTMMLYSADAGALEGLVIAWRPDR